MSPIPGTTSPGLVVETLSDQRVPDIALCLDPGLTDGPPPDGEVRQQHICHTDHEHGRPSGVCVLCPHLYSLFNQDCVAAHNSSIIKFPGGMTVVGLITGDDEAA